MVSVYSEIWKKMKLGRRNKVNDNDDDDDDGWILLGSSNTIGRLQSVKKRAQRVTFDRFSLEVQFCLGKWLHTPTLSLLVLKLEYQCVPCGIIMKMKNKDFVIKQI